MSWTFKQREFQCWLSMPESLRPDGMKTMQDFAARTKLTVQTLKAWKTLPGFWDGVNELSSNAIREAIPDIVEVLIEKARNGNLGAIKIALTIAGFRPDNPQAVTNVTVEKDDQLVIVLTSPQDRPSLPPTPRTLEADPNALIITRPQTVDAEVKELS